MSNFAIPGFQTPSHPKIDDNVTAGLDGRIEFPFLENIPIGQTMPRIDVYLSTDMGTQVTNLAKLINGSFVYSKADMDRGLKSYWVKILPSDLRILPGTYVLRFIADGQLLAQKSVTIPPSPLQQRDLPENSYPTGPLTI